jgi:hypothetical protein
VPDHTPAALQRLCLDAPDPGNFAAFFRDSPRSEAELQTALQAVVARQLFHEQAPQDKSLTVFVSFDDCTSAKDKQTHALQAVDWTLDHTRHQPCKGAVRGACRVHVGPHSYPFSWRLYLRAGTVRRLNKGRPKEQRLVFRSELGLAREMLAELEP